MYCFNIEYNSNELLLPSFATNSLKLQGIKLVMKTLGAGFHQHIEGVHCLSLVIIELIDKK